MKSAPEKSTVRKVRPLLRLNVGTAALLLQVSKARALNAVLPSPLATGCYIRDTPAFRPTWVLMA
jgi:hypothetical protein